MCFDPLNAHVTVLFVDGCDGRVHLLPEVRVGHGVITRIDPSVVVVGV
jgi:hypothetical protein